MKVGIAVVTTAMTVEIGIGMGVEVEVTVVAIVALEPARYLRISRTSLIFLGTPR